MIKIPKADITEIFSSVQGEGIFLGARQIFVRFKKCNMLCAFCDTPNDSYSKKYSPDALMKAIARLETCEGPHHSVSLTGGEPLVYAEFLKEFLPLLKKSSFISYLETNGSLPGPLSQVIDNVDIIAMDFKLPSSTGGSSYWKEHLEFLKIAAQKKVFVKAVVTSTTTKDDIERSAALIKEVDRSIPFILQPATPVKKKDTWINGARLSGFLKIGARHDLATIRTIPQIHKILKIR